MKKINKKTLKKIYDNDEVLWALKTQTGKSYPTVKLWVKTALLGADQHPSLLTIGAFEIYESMLKINLNEATK